MIEINADMPRIFRGKIGGKEKYCRVLVRYRNLALEKRKHCPICGELPLWRWTEGSYILTCDKCGIEVLCEDAETLVERWNAMDAETLRGELD